MGTNSYVTKLKAQLNQAIIQREHWKQLAKNRNSIVVTEVCPESRSVEEYIIDADSVRASWRLIRGYREKIEALRAENGRLQADRDRANQYANQQALECNKLSTDLEAARGLLESAVVLFACHCTDATAKNWHDAAAAFLTATPAPEVPDHTEQHLEMAEQGERQEAVAEVVQREPYEDGTPNPCKTLAWSLDNCEDDLPTGTKLYTTPQPGPDVRGLVSADDVRDACANAVSVFAEETNADQCREVAEYMREVLLAQIAHRQDT